MNKGIKIMLLGLLFMVIMLPHFLYVINNQVHIDCVDDNKYNATCLTAKGLANTSNLMWLPSLLFTSLIPIGFIVFIIDLIKGGVKDE